MVLKPITMPAPKKPDLTDLPSLAENLVKNGPVKFHPCPRRVRILHHGQYIIDTTSAVWVWEHAAYPYFYVPRASLAKDVILRGKHEKEDISGKQGYAYIMQLDGKGWSTDRVIYFEPIGERTRNAWNNAMLRIEFSAVDQWLEEDVPTLVHPKDPFKRIDCLSSLRHIRITIPNPHSTSSSSHPHPTSTSTASSSEDLELANTPQSIHLHETGLPVRYYMPLTALNVSYLRKSSTRSVCPYKGEAEYYDVVIPDPERGGTGGGEGEEGDKGGNGEKVLKDVVWYYDRPNLEVAQVEKLVCFYGEKVDVWVDGVKGERPVTWFS